MAKVTKVRIFEWLGVITAIVYSLLVAANIGAEFIGFTLLLISSALILVLKKLLLFKVAFF